MEALLYGNAGGEDSYWQCIRTFFVSNASNDVSSLYIDPYVISALASGDDDEYGSDIANASGWSQGPKLPGILAVIKSIKYP